MYGNIVNHTCIPFFVRLKKNIKKIEGVGSLLLQILGNIKRVPTQIAFSNSMCFPRFFFSVSLQISPVPIYVICDYYIHKTDLADFSSFKKKKWKFSWQI